MHIRTKGDDNNVDDRGLYPETKPFLHRDDIIGKAIGFVVNLTHFLTAFQLHTLYWNDINSLQ